MSRTRIRLELLPHERAALLRWNFTPEVRDQLERFVSSDAPETIEAIDSMAKQLKKAVMRQRK